MLTGRRGGLQVNVDPSGFKHFCALIVFSCRAVAGGLL